MIKLLISWIKNEDKTLKSEHIVGFSDKYPMLGQSLILSLREANYELDFGVVKKLDICKDILFISTNYGSYDIRVIERNASVNASKVIDINQFSRVKVYAKQGTVKLKKAEKEEDLQRYAVNRAISAIDAVKKKQVDTRRASFKIILGEDK